MSSFECSHVRWNSPLRVHFDFVPEKSLLISGVLIRDFCFKEVICFNFLLLWWSIQQ